VKLHFYICIFCCLAFTSKATPIVIENDSIYTFNIQNFYLFEDTSNKVTINDLLAMNSNFEFEELTENSKNLGFSNSAFWLKIDFTNNTEHNNFFLFSIKYPLLNDLQFFDTKENQIVSQIQTGENYPHASRPINNKDFMFRLNIPKHSNKTFYFRLYNNGETLRLPLQLVDVLSNKQHDSHEVFQLAMFYGYALFAFIFNILLFVEIRKKLYLYLSLFIIFISFFFFTIDGVAFQYFWPNNPYFANRSMVFFSSLAMIAMVLFANDFLKTENKVKETSKFLIIGLGIIIIWNLLPTGINNLSILFANIFVFISVAYILFLSFKRYRKRKNKHNFVFFLSFALLLSGTMVYILRNLGITPDNFITQHCLKIGFSAQVTLISFATILQFRNVLRDTNIFLEEMVKKRTNVVTKQNLQLRNQNDKIESQYSEIRQSIHYAKRIQHAILPHNKKFSALFEDHMILYKPKDIVSGDFYWVVAGKNNKTYIAAADCTGHGVPGGFLSMLGISFLNQIINANPEINPNQILNKLRALFTETLNNNSNENSSRDSMDISICLFDHAKKEMEYAGAYNSLLVIRNNELIELKVCRMSLESDRNNETKEYRNYTYDLKKDDKIYMFSDGYHDQFGGKQNKRLTKKRFKNILLETSNLSLQEQKDVLDQTIEEWKGTYEQVDDMLILGLLI